jgi:phage terminase large subunit
VLTTTPHEFTPYGACRTAFEFTGDELLVSGPAGTGKSRALLERLHAIACFYPGMRGLIVRKTLASLGSTALVTFREQVAAQEIADGKLAFFSGSPQRAAAYEYTNGSTIVVGGMDKATRIMSSEYDVIYVQEAIELTINDWEALTTRLRHGVVPFQQLIADTNPDTPTHWLKQRCDLGQTQMLESRHEDNPTLVDPDTGAYTVAGKRYLAKLDNLTGPRHARLRRGLWVAAEGVIYDQFDPAVHLVDRFPIPKEWPRYWAVDFGHTNPFVLQWWAQDPDGRLFLYREIYRTRQLVEDHAKVALRAVSKLVDPDDEPAGPRLELDGQLREWVEPKPRAVICDHDAEGRATLERHLRLGTVKANKNVTAGIEAVQVRLRSAADGRPRLFLLRDSVVERDLDLLDAKLPTCTADEIPGYIWAPTPDGKPNKDEPLKKDDHGCDATRYLVAEFDLAARPGVRFV